MASDPPRSPDREPPRHGALRRMPYLPELDGVRAVAILIVFIGHARLAASFPAGFGVTIFFFLSGYLITTLLRIERDVTGHVDLKAFYVRRVLRINPPLWLTMLAIWILCATGLIQQILHPLAIAGEAFFFVNYLSSYGQDDGLPIPLWSLAVEEHFYLIFPAAFMFASRRIPSVRIADYCAAACVIVLLVRLVNILIFHLIEPNYYWTHTRIDSILFGCILALKGNPLLDANAWRPKLYHVALAISALLVTFTLRHPLAREGFRYTLQGVALFVIFAWMLQTRGGWLSSLLTFAPVQLIGKYSYTLYLVHYGIIVALRGALPGVSPWVQAAISGTLSMLFAAAMYSIVERPLGRLRHRLNKVEDQRNRPASP